MELASTHGLQFITTKKKRRLLQLASTKNFDIFISYLLEHIFLIELINNL